MVTITNDGCAVEVYALLPAMGEPDLIHALAPDGGSILDLGAGVGRIADPLVALGHRVVAVDDSADMLARVQAAERVRSRIEDLRLDETFDVVVLASHLINVDDPASQRGFLDTVAHHLRRDGLALIEWHPPEWFDNLRAGDTTRGTIGELAVAMTVHSLVGDLLSATVEYEAADLSWRQHFRARRLTAAQLREALDRAGLALGETPQGHRNWLIARPA